MGDHSKIEWTDASWTPIRARNLETGKLGWHCEHATTGCEFCYAESMNLRLGTGLPFKPGHRKDIEIFLDEKMLLAPLRWKRPRMVFVCSMTDLFADFVKNEWIDQIFAVMALCPQHTFQVLTKRAARMRDYCTDMLNPTRLVQAALSLPDGEVFNATWPLPNVWKGTSCERQQEADERIPLLLQTPAAVRFVSCEPLLSHLDLSKWLHDRRRGSVFSASSDGDIPSGSIARQDLATSGIHRGTCADAESGEPATGGKKCLEEGRLSPGHVSRSGEKKESLGASNYLDSRKLSPHSGNLGNQPFGRRQAKQQVRQFGNGDADRERQSLLPGTEPKNQRSTWRKKFFGGRNGCAGDRDSYALESQSNESIGVGESLRGHAVNDLCDRDAQELGASSLDWVIAGGESGPHARPMHPQWARDLRDQCQAAGVPYFFKQWGEWGYDERVSRKEMRGNEQPHAIDERWSMICVGKKAAGRLLDGVEHNGFPEARA